jgi:hypothetical protein
VQKARVVELVKRVKHAMTLSVGDGANDVGMLRVADIGVGIRGSKEGQQAVMASDYTIGQFKYLSRLLLVHGRWSYHRVASTTLMSFYKNIGFSLVLFWYQVDCLFTAQFIYDYMYMLFWNLFLSVAPVLVLGILDKDIMDETVLQEDLPQLYQSGIRHEAYSIGLFFWMLLEAIYQSLVCYFLPIWIYSDHVPVDKSVLGTVVGVSVLVMTNLVIGMNNRSWSLYTFVSVCTSILLFAVLLLIFANIKTEALYGTIYLVSRSSLFYFTVPITVILALAPKVMSRYLMRQYAPSDIDLVNEAIAERNRYYGNRDLVDVEEGISRKESIQAWMERVLGHRKPPKILQDLRASDTISASRLRRALDVIPHPPRMQRHAWSRRSSITSFWDMRTRKLGQFRGFAFSQDGGITPALLTQTRVPFGALLPAMQANALVQPTRPPQARIDDRITFI